MVIIELYKSGGIYKDGGSYDLRDNKGNHYWRNMKIPHKTNPNLGKIYKGKINDKNPKLAKGNFLLENEIIKQ